MLLVFGGGNISRAIEDLAEAAPPKAKEPEAAVSVSA